MLGAIGRSLQGVRVLDISRVLAGPFAAQLLADLGADVIKIEGPGGDETRGWGPPFFDQKLGLSAYFLACNRGKRGLSLDLKKAEGRALFHRLVEKSDVVIENMRPASLAALGMDNLHRLNKQLIVCSISGFGRDNPQGQRPGYDFVVQGLSGLMATTGAKKGAPTKVSVAMTDIVTGLYAASAISAALYGREQAGQGYHIELALIDCAVASLANLAQSFLTSGKVPPRQGNAHLQIVPYELFQTADGWLILAVGNDAQWQRFCAAAGASELGSDARYISNAQRVSLRDELVPKLVALLQTRTTAEWEKILAAACVPSGPVWDFAQLFASDLAAERGLKITARRADGTPVDLLRSPLTRKEQAAPPTLGEHSREVLTDVLGLSDAELAELERTRVI